MATAAASTRTTWSIARGLGTGAAAAAFTWLCLRGSGRPAAVLAAVFAGAATIVAAAGDAAPRSRLGRLVAATALVGCFVALVSEDLEIRRSAPALAAAVGFPVALLLICASLGGRRAARAFFVLVTAGAVAPHVFLNLQPGSGHWTADPALSIARATFLGEDVHYSPFWTRDALVAVLCLVLVNVTFAPAMSLLAPRGRERGRRGRVALALVGLVVAVASVYGLWARSRSATFARNVLSIAQEESRRASTLRALRERSGTHAAQPVGPLLDGPRAVVVVIGASAARDHWQLYGYPRHTNDPLVPWAARLSLYSDAVTPHSRSDAVLESVLVGEPGPGGSAAPVDLVSLARDAGYEVSWISAHAAEGRPDDVARAVAAGADERIFLGAAPGRATPDGRAPDEGLAAALDATLARRHAKHLVFVHMTGPREPYCSADAALASGPPPTGPTAQALFGVDADVAAADCYDRAMTRGSAVLADLLDVASRRGVDTLLYFSEHGETPETRTGHDPGVHAAEHVRVPLLWWLAPAFWEGHAEVAASIRSNRDKPVLASDLHDTLQDLLGAEEGRFDARRSLLRTEYVSSTRILFGRFDYDRWSAGADELERARANLRELARSRPDLYPRVWALKVDSLGKLRQAMSAFAGVELNLVYDGTELVVRHPPSPGLGITLREYLRVAAARPDLRLWFDMKLSPSAADDAAVERALAAIDREYGVRDRCIVELPTERVHAALASALAARSWHVSRYLPAHDAGAVAGPRTRAFAEFVDAERDYLRRGGFAYVSYEVVARDLASRVVEDPRAQRVERLAWDIQEDSSARDFLQRISRTKEAVFLVVLRSAYED